MFESCRRPLHLGIVLCLAAFLGDCSEQSVGPTKNIQSVAVGDTIAGNLGGGGPLLYAFQSYQDSFYAVFLQSDYGSKQVTATDTGTGLVLAVGGATAGPTLLERGVGPFTYGNAPILLTIEGDPGGFRFFVYPVHRGPEGRAVRFALGDTVTEALQTLADIDTFTFAGQAGQEVIAFVEALNDSPVGSVAMDIGRVIQAGSAVGSTDLEQNGTGRFQLSATRDYRVTVQAATSIYDAYRHYRGPYRFQVRSVQRTPEHVPGTIAPGDSVTAESIDYVGDVDAYGLSGSPGTPVNVFLQARTGLPATKFFLRGSIGDSLVAAASTGTDTSLFNQFSGRLQLGGLGHDSVRVEGESDRALEDRGSYRLFVYPVNAAPETAAATLVAGDSVMNEAIELPGDLDTFQVTVPESGFVNLVMQLGGDANGASTGLDLENAAGTPLATATVYGPGGFGASGNAAVTSGTYRLRVNPDPHSGFRGHYRVWTFAGFTYRPETAPDTIAVGDTIASEAITAPGDVDFFHVYTQAGDHLTVALQGTSSGSGSFGASFGPAGGPPIVLSSSPLVSDSLTAFGSGRIDVPATGWYDLRIDGQGPTPAVPAGSYRFAVMRFNTAPEHVGAALVPGDSVTGESIDYPGDWDQFTVTGSPGRMIAVMTRLPQEPTSYSLVTVFDSISTDTLAAVVPQGFDKATARVVLPSSGKVQVAVYQPPPYYTFTGSYYLRVIPVNPAPESVPATFAIGDTVRGEAISPAMDLDEFTGSATAGQQLAPFYRLTADPSPAGLITLEIVDPATGAILAGSGVSLNAATPGFLSPGGFIVPASGQFIVRVRSYNNDDTTAPYEFYVR